MAGCGASTDGAPSPRDGVARPLEAYRAVGLLAGGERFPAVAGFSQLAGPGDSTLVLLGLSLANEALRFQRDEHGFIGEYVVSVEIMRGDSTVHRTERREQVRVPSFAETARTDESVVFQTPIVLAPGRYLARLRVRDGYSAAGFAAEDTLHVRRFGGGGGAVAGPVLVYAAAGRAERGALPDLVLNPRHAAAYGAEDARVYVERYGAAAGDTLLLRVVDEQGNEVHLDTVHIEGEGLRHAVATLPQTSLPLGPLWIVLERPRDDAPLGREPLLVTISDQWIVANFEQVLQFLAYIARPAELDSLREGGHQERRERWERFWARRDPLPATPVNEYREEFFERLRTASVRFSEPGQPGWRTDRGEVYVVLGPPSQVFRQRIGERDAVGGAEAEAWLYERVPGGRLELVFVDRTGFGRYELTPSSRVAFRSAAARVKMAY